MRYVFYLIAGLIYAAPLQAADSRPNILIVMLDDLGYSDLGCYGGEIKTPNIDALAKNGLRFTRFYNCARCCPTRASLLTGVYQHQVGLEKNGRSLTRDGVTISEVLKDAGYQTAMAGKWHLSETYVIKPAAKHQRWLDHRVFPKKQPFGPPGSYPTARGFDKFYGIIWGVVNYFDPFSLVDGDKPVTDVPKDYYITDAITQHAVRYIRDAKKDRPLFLYVAHCAPHWPLHARPEDIAKYKDKYNDGWFALRQQRYKRQVAMGLIDPKTHPLPPLMGGRRGWKQLSKAEREMQAAKMRVHAAMVDRVDQGIGEIIKELKKTGRFENTAIFILADNGASPEVPRRPGYDRNDFTRDGRKIRYSGFKPSDVGSQTTYTGIGPQWANAANTPFRYWKKESFEGGMHTPFIVHWPAGLKLVPGTKTDRVGHVMDLMPTCLDLAKTKYPKTFAGKKVTPREGYSLLPILKTGERDGHQALYFEHTGGKAVVAGGYKLVQPTRSKRWELYDFNKDRTETKNIASGNPAQVRKMTAMWQAWSKRVGVKNR